ncbi:hypothetical protein [Paludibaculum fermentans]|uniref:hypothetical protein n=1 Tax=Paludibaculum fermentans TaxID=1473598 RepID=UPI003EBD8880
MLILVCLNGQILKAGTAYSDIAESWPNVIGIGVTDSDYEMANSHTAYATVTITSPSGRTITSTGSNLGSVTVYAYLDLAGESGTYSVLNVAREFCPAVGVSFSDGQSGTATVITAFVWIDSVTFTPSVVAQKNGKSEFKAVVARSSTCGAASVDIDANIYPLTTNLKMLPVDPNHLSKPFTDRLATFIFKVETAAENETGGSIQGSAAITAAGVCGDKSGPKSTQLTVQ